ncbi:MAG: phosphoribosylglycinamide formyltransferase [Nitrospirota bacterium]|nr:phosphoribosylglycinamide formyltransferase [Nitrospirota bacterium]
MPEQDGCVIGILASGRGSNMAALLEACASGEIPARVAVVLSDREQAGALETARRMGVDAVHLNPRQHGSREGYDRALVAELRQRGVNLVCLAGYMKLVTREFLAPYAGRVLNIHPSLLPSFPGLDAQQQAFDYGVKVAGCTVHLVELAMDSGPVVMQAAVPVMDDDTAQSLSARILEQEHRIYVEAVCAFAEERVRVEGRRIFIRAPRK